MAKEHCLPTLRLSHPVACVSCSQQSGESSSSLSDVEESGMNRSTPWGYNATSDAFFFPCAKAILQSWQASKYTLHTLTQTVDSPTPRDTISDLSRAQRTAKLPKKLRKTKHKTHAHAVQGFLSPAQPPTLGTPGTSAPVTFYTPPPNLASLYVAAPPHSSVH